MSFQAMITGKLTRPPQTKTSKNGNLYVWMLLSVPTEQERMSASVLGFDDSVTEIMGKLTAGDEIAITGTASINQWEREDGSISVSLNVIASQVMTMHQHRKKKKQIAGTQEAPQTKPNTFDDDVNDIL